MRFRPMIKPALAVLAMLSVAAHLVGCTALAKAPPANGHLVIVGGALKETNQEVYGRIASLAGQGKIGVVPTATGVPEESIPGAVGRIEKHTGEGGTVVVDIRFDHPEEAANPKWEKAIDDSSGLFFLGGDQSRILNAFRPESGDTISYAACMRLLDRGGFISGTSAGAAMMSDPMIQGGSSTAALKMGVTDVVSEDDSNGVKIGKGMGFFPYGLTDQHFLERGRLGRLVVALDKTGQRFGYGIAEDRALLVDLSKHELAGLGGARAVLVVDMGSVKREGKAFHNIRLSLLNSGDAVDSGTGAVTPAAGQTPYVIPSDSGAKELTADDAWASQAIPDLMTGLVTTGAARAVALDPNFEVILMLDNKVRAWVGNGDAAKTPTIANMRMDIVPRAAETASAVAR